MSPGSLQKSRSGYLASLPSSAALLPTNKLIKPRWSDMFFASDLHHYEITHTKVVIQYSKIANSSCLNNTSSPPTAPFHVGSVVSICHCFTIVISTALLARIIRTVFRWVFPRKIALKAVIPVACKILLDRSSLRKTGYSTCIRTCKRIFTFRATKQWTWIAFVSCGIFT